jgi:hypothetical protein
MSRWGRDVLHPEGNLLIRFGMIRFRIPGQPGSSRYRCRWADHWIELHSTCAGIYSETGAGIVFLRPIRAAPTDMLTSATLSRWRLADK